MPRPTAFPLSLRLLVAATVVLISLVAVPKAFAAVSVTRADVSTGTLRLDGRATANRTITVDGTAMTRSTRRGTFAIVRSGYTPPADCTVDVNDGSAQAAVARLTGCTTGEPAPAPAPAPVTNPVDFTPEGGTYVIPLEVGVFANRFFWGSGGTLPYRWTVATGALPPGMSVIQDDPNGTLARVGGTPTAAGTYVFALRVTDARGATATHEVTMTIGDGTVLPGDPGTGLISLILSPSSVTGGTATTGSVTLGAPAPAGGGFTSVSSSDRRFAVTPDSVTVPAGSSTATFPISTVAVTTTTTVTISASYGGVTRNATLTLNPAAATPPPTSPTTADTVSIGRAEYDSGKRQLRVEATSNRSGVTLRAYTTSTGALLGTLSGGAGQFSVSSNPGSVTVKSSGGGSAMRTVTAK